MLGFYLVANGLLCLVMAAIGGYLLYLILKHSELTASFSIKEKLKECTEVKEEKEDKKKEE